MANNKITDLDNHLVAIYHKDHTQFYANCPISKTGFSISAIIDMKASEDYPFCFECPFYNFHGGCAYARKKAGIPDDAELLGYQTDLSKWPIYAEFTVGGQKYSSKLQPGKNMGESIVDIWTRLKPDVACFVNFRTGKYVRLAKDPKEQFSKYHGKCFGWFSSDGFHYSKNSVALFGVSAPCWMCTWYKKGGETKTGPYGYEFPI